MRSFPLLDFFYLLCGIALFLYGMQLGEKSLSGIGQARLRTIITAITRNRVFAYFTGVVTTLITQSSSATTVILVTLASSNLITLQQSLGMILGSDLATTVTVQLFVFKFYHIAPLLIAAGYVLTQWRSAAVRRYAGLLLSFGFIFFGMKLMVDAVEPLRSLSFVNTIIEHSLTMPLAGILVGTVLAGIVQSSAAIIAIVIAVALSENTAGIPFDLYAYFPLVIGANIGTCATAFLSSAHAHTPGARVAWAHFFFKLAGALLTLPALSLLSSALMRMALPIPLTIAAAHTVFNLLLALFFLPITPVVARLIEWFVKPVRRDRRSFRVAFINQSALDLPVLAIEQVFKESIRMADCVIRMVEKCGTSLERYRTGIIEEIKKADDEVDFLHEELIKYLNQINQTQLLAEQSRRVYALLMAITDLEHIGDIVSKSLTTFAEKIDAAPLIFSEAHRTQVLTIYQESLDLLRKTCHAFAHNDAASAAGIFSLREETTTRLSTASENSISHMTDASAASLESANIFVDLVEEIGRLNNFTFRLAAHMQGIHRVE